MHLRVFWQEDCRPGRTVGPTVVRSVLAAALVTMAAACKRAGDAGGAGGAPPPPQVTVSPPVEKEIVEWNEYIGRTDAVESVEVRARVSGYLQQIAFKPGDIVKKDSLLFVIDPRPYQADLDRAKAQLDQAEAQLKLGEADFSRAKDLRQKNVTSGEEFDTKSSTYKQNQGTVGSARAAVETAQLNLDFCYIKSPIEGRVSRENITIGNLVQPSTTADGILTTVVSIDPIYAYMDVDENTILNYIKLNQEGKMKTAREARVPLYLALQNEKGFPHEGYVDFVDNRIDAGTGTMRVRGVFKTWDPLLTPGFFVRVRAAASPKYKALLLPDRAVGVDQNQRFVVVVKPDKTAEYRTVTLGPIVDGMRVIREGLKPGESVVITGVMRARPGAPVDPKEEKLTTPPDDQTDVSKATPPLNAGATQTPKP